MSELFWFDEDLGLCGPPVVYKASSYCDERPLGMPIVLVVMHYISLPPHCFGGDDVVNFFTGCLDYTRHPSYASLVGVHVSSHFFIRRTGEIIQLVPIVMRAWHAGISSWRSRSSCNDFAIGIEMEGDGVSPFQEEQYVSAARIIRLCQLQYPLEACVGHEDIAPGRKEDPGPCFAWSHFLAKLPGLTRF